MNPNLDINENVKIFRKSAMKAAFEAGAKSAMADPSRWKEVFEAGEKKGAAWLNESVDSKSFFEFMNDQRLESPGDFDDWYNEHALRISTSMDRVEYQMASDESKVVNIRDREKIDLDVIERTVRYTLGVKAEALRNDRRRKGEIKKPRFYAMYLAYHYAPDKLHSIGQRWGDKHHATVLHAAKCIGEDAALYEEDMKLLQVMYRYLYKKGYDIYTRVDQRTKAPWVEPKF